MVAGTAAVVLVVGSGTAGALALYRRPLPVATVATTLGGTVQVPGVPPVMPWPSVGQGAIAVPALGVAEQSGPEQPVPVASLTKITVAAVVLRDHPLAAGASGPAITVTEADAATYGADAHDDQSTVPVRAGEVLTEEQMIDALLLASANNLATALARWDAGSQGAFVTRMNALAASLGMSSTHYADASGFDPHTVSSAADVLKVTAYAMSEPAFADAVAMRSVTVPVAGTIHNIVSEVTSGSAIGVKSGYTSEAGGCLVLARRVAIGSTPVLVLAAVVGQPVPPPVPPTTTSTTFPYIADPMEFTRPPADHLLDAVAGGVRPVRVAVARRVVGQVDVRWSGARHRAPVATTVTAVLAGWPGLVVTQRVDVRPVRPGDRAGTGAGSVTYQLGAEHVRVPLELAAAAPAPDL